MIQKSAISGSIETLAKARALLRKSVDDLTLTSPVQRMSPREAAVVSRIISLTVELSDAMDDLRDLHRMQP
jgi:hypothetical protein